MIAKMTTEAAREREAFRYDPSLLAKSIVNEAHTPLDPTRLSTSSDPALSAFTQLGALRLGAKRCLISIFDRKYQHIVAESTAVTTLGPNESQDEADADAALWLCGTAIPRSYGVCEHVITMTAADNSTKTLEAGEGSCTSQELGELPVSVIPDLAADSRFHEKPYVGRNNKSLRFYAGVSLRTRRGIDIGVYCVFGQDPRDHLEPAQTDFLRDMSRTVMSYLEQRASASSHRRNVRMLRGLGSLVEGQGSMSNWWQDHNPASFTTATGDEGALNTKQQALQRATSEAVLPTPPRPQPVPFTHHSESPSLSETTPSLTETQANSSDSVERQSTMSGSATRTARMSSLIHDREDESISQLQNLFSRAANIVRESVEVEGALFLDAAVGSFGGLATQGRRRSGTSSEAFRDQYSTSSSAEENKSKRPDNGEPAMCKILGFSQTETSSIDGDRASPVHSVVPERFLKSVLRRYPNGTIFNFDENGALQSGDSEDATMLAKAVAGEGPLSQQKGRCSDRDILVAAFAGARSVALIPLWDSHKERWYAGGFVWTRTPTRIFTVEGELSYLKALGMIVMAEVARINTLRADKAKADVLGSLSHELRSPLHGVVLGVELLHDTQLSGFQEDVINTVETCSRTLMETMDHLLDFSKINYFTKQVKKDRTTTARGGYMHKNTTMESGMMSLFTNVSLDSLVEEVIETVYAGHSFQQTSGSWRMTTRYNTTSFGQAGTLRRLLSLDSPISDNRGTFTSGGMNHRPLVAIYLDIEHGVSWNFYTQPGAIRRVIMNLFGNSLKYTAEGSIVISMKQVPPSHVTKGKRNRVVFSISDSGKGISADYLRNQIFTPFSQEDHLAPGAGLGMSLVKQIVHSLKGEIGVESRVGRGTMVKVTLPLLPSRISPGVGNTTPAETDFLANVNGLRGKSVCLVGFKDVEDPDYPLLTTTSLPPSPKALMGDICQKWLGMELVSIEDASSTQPSVFIITQESMEGAPDLPNPGPDASPVLMMCQHALAAHELAMLPPSSERLVTFISQPPGPRKLAKVLTNVISRVSQARAQRPILHPASDPPHLADAVATPTQGPGRDPTAATEMQHVVVSAQPSVALRPLIAAEPPADEMEQRNCFLLVDDNTINLKILSSYMRKLKRGYDTAENGLQALEAFRQSPEKYCCIFMDISMPIMDGLEATRGIRIHEQRHKLSQILVVALTGLASADTQKDAFASGVNLFLTKPVPLKELSRILETHKL